MRLNRIAFCLAASLISYLSAFGQEFVTEQFLRNRLLTSPELECPVIDRARVPGKVIVSVEVDRQGSVSHSEVLAGHPLLDDSALNYVRRCRFAPLRQGTTVKEMSGIMTIWFDFVVKAPMRGLDLPMVKVLDQRLVEVQGRTMDWMELVRWLGRKRLHETSAIVRLSAAEKSELLAEFILLLRQVRATEICVHLE